MTIKAVIFDMGGVLLDAVNYKYFKKMEGLTNTDEKTIRNFIVSLLVDYESRSTPPISNITAFIAMHSALYYGSYYYLCMLPF